jgi:hypothetical protein
MIRMKSKLVGMTRRRFLLSGTLVATTFASSSCSYSLTGLRASAISDGKIKAGLRQLFSDRAAARGLGKRYIDLYPREAQRILLFEKLVSSLQPGSSRELKAIIARERESDFQNNRIVIIDGWLLARTEAEVCALTVLL